MKPLCVLFFVLFPMVIFSQDKAAQSKIDVFNSCQTLECQLSEALKISEFYIETDHQDKAQEWLTYAKKLNQFKPNDSISYFINSMQSEVFYYMELYQFGVHEAEKGIEKARIVRDSAFLADAYFFKGINQIERNEVADAQQSLWLSQKWYPKRQSRKHLRTLIVPAYIYNNLAQIKLKTMALDSALIYNRKAHALARKNDIRRGIVNGEQTFGLIFAAQQKQDSARFYLEQSIASAEKFEMHDVVTLNCAYLMQSHADNPQKVNEFYHKGLHFMTNYEVNNSYERLFYSIALDVFRKLNDQQKILLLQQRIIEVNADTNNRANYYIQNIIEQYMKNENKLLVSKINQLNQDRNIAILQLVAALLGFLILLFVALFFRRKNKLQQSLLDQKNEISKDLHDDIGSELGSILINANLLGNYSMNDKQQYLVAKIASTGTEISQRLNAFIWSLNNDNNSLVNFSEYVKRYAGNLLEGTGIALHYSDNMACVEDKILNGYFRKNLFFCIKESLNNTVRHASATTVRLSVIAKEKELQITIHDDGIGVGENNTLGNGFRNITKRTEALDGTASFENQDGLIVMLKVPLSNN